MRYIDFSQFDTFMRCQYEWVEKYANCVKVVYSGSQRDDAMALGSLVHGGLEIWHTANKIEIPQATIDEINPTPELIREAQRLLVGYAQTYGHEQWKFEVCEGPVEFKIGVDGWKGLAKIDRFFRVDTQTLVKSGLGDGGDIWLAPGWWIDEKKTKSAGIDRGWWMRDWVNKMQASFQILALEEKIGEPIAGMLVTVLEKEDTYKPKRKCKKCGLTLEMSTYRAAAGGLWACGMCGGVQELSPAKSREDKLPEYFRIQVTRTKDRLELDKAMIKSVVEMMDKIVKEDESFVIIANRRNCVDLLRRRACEYFVPHSADLEASEIGEGFEKDENPFKYLGLEVKG